MDQAILENTLFSVSLGLFVAVHGSWLAWDEWSECSVTCAGGKQRRIRQCSDPLHGGELCVGTDVEFKPCGDGHCPVNGAWSAWSMWTPCSITCSNGITTRMRKCDSPAPASGGQLCDGQQQESEHCSEGECPGEFNMWQIPSVTYIF